MPTTPRKGCVRQEKAEWEAPFRRTTTVISRVEINQGLPISRIFYHDLYVACEMAPYFLYMISYSGLSDPSIDLLPSFELISCIMVGSLCGLHALNAGGRVLREKYGVSCFASAHKWLFRSVNEIHNTIRV